MLVTRLHYNSVHGVNFKQSSRSFCGVVTRLEVFYSESYGDKLYHIFQYFVNELDLLHENQSDMQIVNPDC